MKLLLPLSSYKYYFWSVWRHDLLIVSTGRSDVGTLLSRGNVEIHFSLVKLIQVLQGSGWIWSAEAEATHINPFPPGKPLFCWEQKSPNGFHVTPPHRLGHMPSFNALAQSEPPAVISSCSYLNICWSSVSPSLRRWREEKSLKSGEIPEYKPLCMQGRGCRGRQGSVHFLP